MVQYIASSPFQVTMSVRSSDQFLTGSEVDAVYFNASGVAFAIVVVGNIRLLVLRKPQGGFECSHAVDRHRVALSHVEG